MADVIPTKLVADCSTNTVVEMPLTAEEIAEMLTLHQLKQRQTARQQKRQKQQQLQPLKQVPMLN